jgi:hypothetical protein
MTGPEQIKKKSSKPFLRKQKCYQINHPQKFRRLTHGQIEEAQPNTNEL